MFGNVLVAGLINGPFYALTALGFTIFYGTIRLINFAHGDVVMFGAFVGFTVLSLLSRVHNTGVQVTVALLAVIAATALVGLILRWAYAHVNGQRNKSGPLIAAIGMSLVLENGAMGLWGSMPQTYQVQFPGSTAVSLPVLLGACLLIFGGVEWLVHRTRLGMAIRAVGIDHGAVRLMGVRVEWIILFTFALFSAIAGVAGVMDGMYFGSINFLMGFTLGIKGFTAAVFGGIGNVRGALVGGFALSLVEAFGAAYLGSSWTDVIAFCVLILLLVFRPTGILGETIVERM